MGIVDSGLNFILQRVIGTTGASPMTYFAVGSGTGAFPGTETAMYSEHYRQAITTASVATNVLTWKIYYTTAQASGIIRELGVFNAATAGTMFAHIEVNPQKTKTNAQEMVIELTTTISRA